jgi:hypothetical protein
MRSALSLSCLMLAACGSLVGSQGLRRIDTLDVPRNLAWEVRWLQQGGLIGQCALLPLASDDVDLTYLPFAQLDMLAPQPQERVAWQTSGAATISVAIVIAVTRGSEDVLVRTATEQSPLESAFGVPDFAYVHVEGSAEDASDAVGFPLVEGGQWLGLNDPRALTMGDLFLALGADNPEDLPWLSVFILEDSDPLEVLTESTLPNCAED